MQLFAGWCACYSFIDFMCLRESGHSACLDLWNNALDGTLFYIKTKTNTLSLHVNVLLIEFIQI